MSKSADICLITEGTYPFEIGGVSSWVHHILKYYATEFTFTIVALTAGKKTEADKRFTVPDNVIAVRNLDLFDYTAIKNAKPSKFSSVEEKQIYSNLHKIAVSSFRKGYFNEEERQLLKDILHNYKEGFFKHFMKVENGFKLFSQIYNEKHGKDGFINYFYNWRTIHLVIWRVFMLINELPKAKIYQAPGTGFAGFLACMMTELYDKPSLITEHGIYMQEREMDLNSADTKWLSDTYMRDMWREFYKALTKYQYERVTTLITANYNNVPIMEEYGADPKKVRVIPNGIKLEQFTKLRRTRLTTSAPVIGMVGRISVVKDIKTFINVATFVKEYCPDLQAYLVGPMDEDYYQECLALREILNAQDYVTFTGRVESLDDYLKKFDIVLLTSVKEAMPLSVMEAMASGLPVVATNVGACDEMLLGFGDDNLGQAGYVTAVMDSQALAMKTLHLINNPKLANKMAQTGIKRVEKYYTDTILRNKYRLIYQELFNKAQQSNKLSGKSEPKVIGKTHDVQQVINNVPVAGIPYQKKVIYSNK
jgi:glycosyltransferase involved in cell wall biosynthesis